MVKIEYWNSYDILDVYYEGGYRNRFWLDVDVMKPEYVVERDAFENGIGEQINTSIKWSKRYSFDVYCTEPLVDALTTITMHDNVWITLDNGYSAECKDFACDVAWQEIDNVARVTVTFVTKTYRVNGKMAANCIPT